MKPYQKRRDRRLRHEHGMTIDEYDEMLAAQDGGCAICGDRPLHRRSMRIDQRADAVRGILCVRCDDALRHLRDDPELILRAAEYVSLGGFAPLELVRREVERKHQPGEG